MKLRALAGLALVLLGAGCGGASPSAPVGAVTPAASSEARVGASAAPSSGTGQTAKGGSSQGTAQYGVLVDLLTSQTEYYANAVTADGKVWKSLKLKKRTPIISQSGHAVILPYVSSSSTALYALTGDRIVTSLSLDGKLTIVQRLAVGAGMEGTFAVSPDDSTIAVGVLDYNRKPVHVTLYTETMTGADHKVIFESDSDYVWPVAWHSGLLVLAHSYGPFLEDVAKAAPAPDDPYTAISYHLVDPATANRKYLLGACTVSGPLSPAGSGCIQGGTIDWQGDVSPPWSTRDWGAISSAAALSPDGSRIAAAEPDNPLLLAIWKPNGSIEKAVDGPGPSDWVGWLDGDHILVGSASRTDWIPRLVRLSDDSSVAVNVRGFYAARLPTDIV